MGISLVSLFHFTVHTDLLGVLLNANSDLLVWRRPKSLHFFKFPDEADDVCTIFLLAKI